MKIKTNFAKIYDSFCSVIPEEKTDKKILKSNSILFIRKNKKTSKFFYNENSIQNNSNILEDDYCSSVYNDPFPISNKKSNQKKLNKTFSKERKNGNFSVKLNNSFDSKDIFNNKIILKNKLIFLFSKLKKKISLNIPNKSINLKSKFSNFNPKINKHIRFSYQILNCNEKDNAFLKHTNTVSNTDEFKSSNNNFISYIENSKIMNSNQKTKSTLIKRNNTEDLVHNFSSNISQRNKDKNNSRLINHINSLNNRKNSDTSNNNIKYNNSNIKKIIYKSPPQSKIFFKKRIVLEEEYVINEKGEKKLLRVKKLDNNNENDEVRFREDKVFIQKNNENELYNKLKNSTQKNFYIKNNYQMYNSANNTNNNICIKNNNNNNINNGRKKLKYEILYKNNNPNNINNILVVENNNFNKKYSFKNTNSNIKNSVNEQPIILCYDFSQRYQNNINQCRSRKATNFDKNDINLNTKNYLFNNYNNNYVRNVLSPNCNNRKNHNFHEIKSLSKDKKRCSNGSFKCENNVVYESKKCNNNSIVFVNNCNKFKATQKHNFNIINNKISKVNYNSVNFNNNDYNAPTRTSSTTQYAVPYIDY